MSDRISRERTTLWLVRRIDGAGVHLFSGDLAAMGAHINRLHRETGLQHAARELGPAESGRDRPA